MATVAAPYDERRVSIGRVFQRAFSAISLNPLVILGLALLVGALPSLIFTFLFYRLGLTNPQTMRSGGLSVQGFGAGMAFSAIFTLIISALVQGALTRATVSAAEGKRSSLGESLASAARVVLPLIGLSILWAFGVGFGFVLLIVPGIFLLLMWAVAVPALVVERDGVFAAFGRSAHLTKGARGKIFGLFLVIMVIYWVLGMVVAIVGLRSMTPSTGANFTLANLIANIVLGTIVNTLWGTIQPSLYVELRQWKEGDGADNLAEVFA